MAGARALLARRGQASAGRPATPWAVAAPVALFLTAAAPFFWAPPLWIAALLRQHRR